MHLTAQLLADTKPMKMAEEILQKRNFFWWRKIRGWLLLKSETFRPPNNYASAIGQLKSLEKRFENDVTLKKRYQETIETKLVFIQEVSSKELHEARNEPQWYIPHHPVINPKKKQKSWDECVMLPLSTMAFNWMIR